MSLRLVRWLLACAILIVAVFLGLHLAGLREHASLLCRIDMLYSPTPREILGLGFYLASYVGFVLIAPVLAIAAGLIFLAAKMPRCGRGTVASRAAAGGNAEE